MGFKYAAPLFLLCLAGVNVASVNANTANDNMESALVDPTRPLHAVVAKANAAEENRPLQLQAVYTDSTRARAVINGKTVVVGDVVEQAKILAIQPDKVIYLKNGVKGKLVLLPAVLRAVED